MMKIGDRITVKMPMLKSWRATIVGEARNGEWWNVLKDDTKYPRGIHKKFCTKEQAHVESVERPGDRSGRVRE